MAAAQTDEWVRDDMSDDSLWLLHTSNLSTQVAGAGLLPGAIGGSSQWVMSKGDGPAYVVYFLPGPIHEVELDTHRLAGAAGDFTLAVSTDGKLYQPIDAGAVQLDSTFGWDYRLMSADQIPANATHLLVQFPDGASAHRLSEVWIRYTWDNALASQFLPAPVATEQPHQELAAMSDADLERLIGQLAASPQQEQVTTAAPAVFSGPAIAPAVKSIATAPAPAPVEYSSSFLQTGTPIAKDAGESSGDDDTDALKVDDNHSIKITLPAEMPETSPDPIATVGTEALQGATGTADADAPIELVVKLTGTEDKHDEPMDAETSAASEPRVDARADSGSSDSPRLTLGLAGEPDDKATTPAKDASESESEKVWVLPTFTLPIAVASNEHSETPKISPAVQDTGIEQVSGTTVPPHEAPAKSSPELQITPTTRSLAGEAKPVEVAAVNTTVPLDSEPKPEAAHTSEPKVDTNRIEVAAMPEPDRPDEPRLRPIRRRIGPRSK